MNSPACFHPMKANKMNNKNVFINTRMIKSSPRIAILVKGGFSANILLCHKMDMVKLIIKVDMTNNRRSTKSRSIHDSH